MEAENNVGIEQTANVDSVDQDENSSEKLPGYLHTPDINIIVEENLDVAGSGDKVPTVTTTADDEDDKVDDDDVDNDDEQVIEKGLIPEQVTAADDDDCNDDADVTDILKEVTPETADQQDAKVEVETESVESTDIQEPDSEPKAEESETEVLQLEQEPEVSQTEPEEQYEEDPQEDNIPQTNGHVEVLEPEETQENTQENVEIVQEPVETLESVQEPEETSESVQEPVETSESAKEEVGSVKVGDIKQRFMKQEQNNNSVKDSISKFNSGSNKEKAMFKVVQTEKCDACQKTVYAMEKLEMNGHIYHKNCFKCSHCSARLTPKTFSMNEGVIYCTNHFKQLFARKGNYDEGFGRQQYKKKWQDSKEVATA